LFVRKPSWLRRSRSHGKKRAAPSVIRLSTWKKNFSRDPRHIEIQALADAHGNAVWLGERDCSIQRRHQKIIEEAPAPHVFREVIAAVGARCVEACRRIGYRGVGTFEFLQKEGRMFFIEMNTRLQVEHPVTEMTEMITGIDPVQAQIRVAQGEPLSFEQGDIRLPGHAIECRINAEHPEHFRPTAGRINQWHVSGGPGIRIDSHAASGYSVPPHYASMIGKVIAHGATRAQAIRAHASGVERHGGASSFSPGLHTNGRPGSGYLRRTYPFPLVKGAAAPPTIR
jgi:acetyl-CoA carboxylase biotin carboxylase subunit